MPHLVFYVVKALFTWLATPAVTGPMLAAGITDLMDDLKFCREKTVRPAKFAEHVSTAADFFYQVSAFEQAEEVLPSAIQACPDAAPLSMCGTSGTAGTLADVLVLICSFCPQVIVLSTTLGTSVQHVQHLRACQTVAVAVQATQLAGQAKLEVTLVNNLGTVLRTRRKFKRALALHRHELASIEERFGLHSSYVSLSRHNVVDLLGLLQRYDEAHELLESQAQQLEQLVEEAKQAKEEGREEMVFVASPSGAQLRVWVHACFGPL